METCNPSDLAELIRRRRTSMLVDKQRPVPHDVDPRPVRAGPMGTEPQADVAVAVRDCRRRGTGPARRSHRRRDAEPRRPAGKGRQGPHTKYLRTPTRWWSDRRPATRRCAPRRTATPSPPASRSCCSRATAQGLASYWSSCPKGANDVVAELCGFEPGTHISALIYLGWATTTVESATPDPPSPPDSSRHRSGELKIGPTSPSADGSAPDALLAAVGRDHDDAHRPSRCRSA